MKLIGIKLKMTQVWKGDSLEPVSVIKVQSGEGLEELKSGDLVKVSGITRSRGWQGVVKRYGFRGMPSSHGAKNRIRAPGSIGNTSPQRIIPGRRMAGRTGGVRRTVKNLKVVDIQPAEKLLMVRGAVPGYNKRSKLEIRK
jgi:large subunit ribosomal protein L3